MLFHMMTIQGHTLREWAQATRPWSFPASTMPVMVAMVWLASQGLMASWPLGLLALVNIVLVHAAGNVWSDYFDYRSGVDAADTYGVRILTDGVFTPRQVLTLSVVLQVLAVGMGLLMVWLTGLPLLWLGLAGIALSLAYPPLKYAALGDVVIMACYSLLPMLGITFICSGAIVPRVLWLAVPVGSITVAILHGNNLRDIETDSRANIRTVALLTGRSLGSALYVAELLMPYVWLLATVLLGHVSPWTLPAFATLPIALRNCRTAVACNTGGAVAIARLDEATAQLQLAFSLSLTAGLVAATFLA